MGLIWQTSPRTPRSTSTDLTVASDTVPDGVRQIDDDGSFAVVFEDPETDVDLVAFTDDDLGPILEAPVPDGGRCVSPKILKVSTILGHSPLVL